jgi:acyl-CoA thioesterase-1
VTGVTVNEDYFGDSLTFGTGATLTESYPAIRERLVGRRVVSSGVPGEVTNEGLSRLREVLAREKPALLILCHGGNDLLRRLDRQQTAKNLRAMIRLARDRGVVVVIIAVPAPGIALSPPTFYRELAAEMGLPVEVEALTMVLSDGSLKSDFIHPNAAGYALTLVAQVEEAYWDYAIAIKNIAIFEDSLLLSRRQFEDTLERIRVGKLADVERVAKQFRYSYWV